MHGDRPTRRSLPTLVTGLALALSTVSGATADEF